MERAIAYIRVSTDRQVRDGTSLDTQKNRVDALVDAKGYEFERLFVEEGESAKTDKRPVLQEMMAYIRANPGRIQVLIFPKVDRFARYAEDYHFLKRFLRDHGIRIESTDEHFDDSPSGRFMENVLAATAQFDNDVRAERSKSGMREGVLRGRWVWKAPRGYRNVRVDNKATIEPDPIRGPLIAEAFERLARRQFRPKDVRAWLASTGVIVSRSHFHRMLFNKAYIGVIEAFDVIERAAPPFLPLVSEATFYGAQEALRVRRGPRVYQRDREDFPLRGTVRCAGCAAFLTASWSKGRSQFYAYYRCKSCLRSNLARAIVNRAFVKALGSAKRSYSFTSEVRDELSHIWTEDRASDKLRLTQLQKEIASLNELQKGIALKSAQGVIPDELAREQIGELGQQAGEKQIQLADIGTAGTNIQRILDFAQAFLADLESYWQGSDLPTKKHIQAFFFPNGATINSDGQIRTDITPPLTGSLAASRSQLSHVVGHTHRSLNRAAHKQHSKVDLMTLLNFFRQIHSEFARYYSVNESALKA
ncbi:MAG: recombinase family protein [Armatimonadetes bacterium]|nr:recombinase family protein [Armatimonadota bacterium]